jgi:hypothetical protein
MKYGSSNALFDRFHDTVAPQDCGRSPFSSVMRSSCSIAFSPSGSVKLSIAPTQSRKPTIAEKTAQSATTSPTKPFKAATITLIALVSKQSASQITAESSVPAEAICRIRYTRRHSQAPYLFQRPLLFSLCNARCTSRYTIQPSSLPRISKYMAGGKLRSSCPVPLVHSAATRRAPSVDMSLDSVRRCAKKSETSMDDALACGSTSDWLRHTVTLRREGVLPRARKANSCAKRRLVVRWRSFPCCRMGVW